MVRYAARRVRAGCNWMLIAILAALTLGIVFYFGAVRTLAERARRNDHQLDAKPKIALRPVIQEFAGIESIIRAMMSLASNTKIGYEIVSAIGAGGMGEVYRARDTRLGREVTLKILPESFASDPDRLRRFEQEARAVAALNHPNILAIHDIGQQSDYRAGLTD